MKLTNQTINHFWRQVDSKPFCISGWSYDPPPYSFQVLGLWVLSADLACTMLGIKPRASFNSALYQLRCISSPLFQTDVSRWFTLGAEAAPEVDHGSYLLCSSQ